MKFGLFAINMGPCSDPVTGGQRHNLAAIQNSKCHAAKNPRTRIANTDRAIP